jgi:integrase/recombinase XerD
MGLAAKLSWWLQSRDLRAADVTAAVIEEFFAERRKDGCARWRTSRSLVPLAECMGIAPGGTAGGLLARYRDYLLAERGLAASTTDRYLQLAAAFLAWLPGGEEGVAGLGAGHVVAYVMEECPRHGGARATLIVTAPRSMLRFLHADGHAGAALAGAVPAAARRRAVRVPAALRQGHIQRLLDSCDRGTGLGTRDYAIILAMARLGLRADEVASLRIADVNWRDGLLAVRGKGNRRDVLPLPDVGHAMAGYLTSARPGRPASPYPFTCTIASYGPLRVTSVGGIVSRACRRAGIPAFGPHRLRHALACYQFRPQGRAGGNRPAAAPRRPDDHRRVCQGPTWPGRPSLPSPARREPCHDVNARAGRAIPGDARALGHRLFSSSVSHGLRQALIRSYDFNPLGI